MRLNKIKIVGFISNFNKKSSYPEFGRKEEVKLVRINNCINTTVKRVKKGHNLELKDAKRYFKSNNPQYRVTRIITNRLG